MHDTPEAAATRTSRRDTLSARTKSLEISEATRPAKKEALLFALRIHGVISKACRDVGVSRQTHFFWCRDDPEFQTACNEMIQEAHDDYLVEARRRAIEGFSRPVFGIVQTYDPVNQVALSRSEIVGHETVYSDKLLGQALSAFHPATHSTRVHHTGNINLNVPPSVTNIMLGKTGPELLEMYRERQAGITRGTITSANDPAQLQAMEAEGYEDASIIDMPEGMQNVNES